MSYTLAHERLSLTHLHVVAEISACQRLDIVRQFLELSIIQSLSQAQLLDELYVSRGTGPTGTVLAMIPGLAARISGRSLPTSAQRYSRRRKRARLGRTN